MKKSAGILLYRFRHPSPEVFLVHPGGPLWKNKDEGAWSIPKGEFENEDAEAAAKREFREETGFHVICQLTPSNPVRQKSGKVVYAFTGEQDIDAAEIKSNLFEMEWPPKSGRKAVFPEVDKAAWFSLADARNKINSGQVPLIDQLRDHLEGNRQLQVSVDNHQPPD